MTPLILSVLLSTACAEPREVDYIPPTDTYQEYTAGNLVATDALGRKLPEYSEVRKKRTDKFVAMFYWTWHIHQSGGIVPTNPVKDVSKILAANPDAIDNYNDPAWPPGNGYYYWGEPLLDYYVDSDKWVLRKHAEMLAEADVDVIVFDCTNGSYTWPEAYTVLCEVFAKAKTDGVDVPQIAFMLGFGETPDTRKALSDIYNNLYKPGKYPELWFEWKGKPLVMGSRNSAASTEISNFFTFRFAWPTYNDAPGGSDRWSWLQIAPQHTFGQNGNEQIAVGVAQNWSKERGLTAMNAPGAFGRSYTDAGGHNTDPDAVNWGLNFQEQWDRAHDVDPELVFVTGWNEWNAGRLPEWQGQYNAFPDQFNQEYSRDIEPMKGGHGDNYYYQLISNIRRYKGMPEPGRAPRADDMAIDGDFTEWDELPAFRSYGGNTVHRNNNGWLGVHYTNTTGRNDIVRSKVAYDDDYLYFYVETKTALTPSSDKNWMMLFINSDRDRDTGWEGYDYVVNRTSPADGKAVVDRNDGGDWTWSKTGEVEYFVRRNKMELRIPREMLDIDGKVELEFKWVDNMQNEGDIMDFYVNGDAAPLGRFNYLFFE